MTSSLPTLKALRVVVIDDELDVRSATARLLEQMGAEVLPLPSGAEFETVLVDIGMPGEDGYAH